MRRRTACILVGTIIVLLNAFKADWIAHTQIQALSITSNAQELAPTDSLTLKLNRLVQPSEGTLAIFIGNTDFTRLFTTTGTQLTYTPSVMHLPAGETRITVWLVTPDEQ